MQRNPGTFWFWARGMLDNPPSEMPGGRTPPDAVIDAVYNLLLDFEEIEDHVRLDRLRDGLKRFCITAPGDSLGWICLLSLLRRTVSPDHLQLTQINRLLITLGMSNRPVRDGELFLACVRLKPQIRDNQRRSMLIATNALGMAALSQARQTAVSMRAQPDGIDIRLGPSQVRYRTTTSWLRIHFAHLFAYEPGMWRWMSGFDADDVFLDIGANVGAFSIAAAGLFGVGTVIAIEPFPSNLQALRTNIALNDLAERITVLPIAASDRAGVDRLYFDEQWPGVASQSFGIDRVETEGSRESIDIEGLPVDDLVRRGTIPTPSRIKIDVDGAEGEVIAGMEQTMANPRLREVRMEIRWWWPEAAPAMARMERHGFAHRVDDDRKNLLFYRRNAGPSG